MRLRFPLFLLALGTCCLPCGCGKGISVPNTNPVQGKVLLNGRAAAGIRVTFNPQFDMGKVKFLPSGITDREGKFALSTAAANDGAPAGEYAVTFAFPQIESDRKNSGIEIEVDAWKGKYADPAQSKYKIQVHKGENNLEAFQLN